MTMATPCLRASAGTAALCVLLSLVLAAPAVAEQDDKSEAELARCKQQVEDLVKIVKSQQKALITARVNEERMQSEKVKAEEQLAAKEEEARELRQQNRTMQEEIAYMEVILASALKPQDPDKTGPCVVAIGEKQDVAILWMGRRGELANQRVVLIRRQGENVAKVRVDRMFDGLALAKVLSGRLQKGDEVIVAASDSEDKKNEGNDHSSASQ